MTDPKQEMPHKLTLSQRKDLTVTGVTEVVSFETDAAVLKTALGTLMIHGSGLKLKNMSMDAGQVDVTGTVTALYYQQQRTGGGLRRLWG